MEASFVFYLEVNTFTNLEQSKISPLIVKTFGIVKRTVHHDLIVSLSFLQYPGDYLRQPTADVISLEQYPIPI